MFGNLLLDRLPPDAQAKLEDRLTRVSVKVGQRLIVAGERVEAVHFPISCQLANLVELGAGGATEVSFIGIEGVSGLTPVLADRICPWAVVVREAGEAWTMPATAFAAIGRSDAAMLDRLLVLSSFYQSQSSQFAACHRHHPISARLARLILTADDLSPNEVLYFTQDELALALGNTRGSVNEEAQHLKETGAMEYHRGRIRILDRAPIERLACECYAKLKAIARADNLL